MGGLLVGKVAAVTGGVTGIGRAIALGFLREGASVTVNYLDTVESAKDFQSLQAEAPGNACLTGVAGDIGKKEVGRAIVEAAVTAFDGLDVFVANAGVSQFKDFLTLEETVLDSHLETNIKGTFWTTQAAAKQMVASPYLCNKISTVVKSAQPFERKDATSISTLTKPPRSTS